MINDDFKYMDGVLAVHENMFNSFVQTWYKNNITLKVNDIQKLLTGDGNITLQDLKGFPRVT